MRWISWRTLFVLLEDMPLNDRDIVLIQHDGAPFHFSRQIKHFPNTWIGHGGPTSRPPFRILWAHLRLSYGDASKEVFMPLSTRSQRPAQLHPGNCGRHQGPILITLSFQVLRTFERKRKEMTRGNCMRSLNDMQSSVTNVRVIKSKSKRWAGHLAYMLFEKWVQNFELKTWRDHL
jgi:hypothetical protein